MKDKIKSYNVGGMPLNVEVAEAELLERVDTILEPFALPEVKEDGFVLQMEHGNPEEMGQDPRELRLVWKGLLPAGLPAVYYADGEVREIELSDLARVRIDTAKRMAKIVVRAGGEWCLGYGCITPVLCEFLSQVGQHVIHTASLCWEDQGGSRAVLLAGPSSSGKTTTALALARSGMILLADDASVVGKDGDDPSEPLIVWGLPRPCKVHKKTLVMLPHLQGLPRRPSVRKDKDLIDIGEITGPYRHRKVRPGLILFLGERNQRRHELVWMDKIAALTELTRQNVRGGQGGFHRRGAGAFRMIGELVAVSESYRLSVGPDLESLRGELVKLL